MIKQEDKDQNPKPAGQSVRRILVYHRICGNEYVNVSFFSRLQRCSAAENPTGTQSYPGARGLHVLQTR